MPKENNNFDNIEWSSKSIISVAEVIESEKNNQIPSERLSEVTIKQKIPKKRFNSFIKSLGENPQDWVFVEKNEEGHVYKNTNIKYELHKSNFERYGLWCIYSFLILSLIFIILTIYL